MPINNYQKSKKMGAIFKSLIIFLGLTFLTLSTFFEVNAKTRKIDNQELATSIEKELKEISGDKKDNKNVPPKEAAAKLLETINQIYVRVPPGYMSKESQETLWLLKGQAYTTLEMFDLGIEAFNEAIKFNPKNLNSYGNISYILNLQGKYKQSIKVSDWIIRKDGFFINTYTNKGYSLLGLGKYQEAIDQFEKARQLDSDNMSVYLGYARGYAGINEYDKAIGIYELLIKYIKEKSQNSPQLKILEELRDEQVKRKEGKK